MLQDYAEKPTADQTNSETKEGRFIISFSVQNIQDTPPFLFQNVDL